MKRFQGLELVDERGRVVETEKPVRPAYYVVLVIKTDGTPEWFTHYDQNGSSRYTSPHYAGALAAYEKAKQTIGPTTWREVHLLTTRSITTIAPMPVIECVVDDKSIPPPPQSTEK